MSDDLEWKAEMWEPQRIGWRQPQFIPLLNGLNDVPKPPTEAELKVKAFEKAIKEIMAALEYADVDWWTRDMIEAKLKENGIEPNTF
jgi:hypothetical protein